MYLEQRNAAGHKSKARSVEVGATDAPQCWWMEKEERRLAASWRRPMVSHSALQTLDIRGRRLQLKHELRNNYQNIDLKT